MSIEFSRAFDSGRSSSRLARPAAKQPSAARVAANRRNAKRSTGPRTVAGKRRASRNAIKHGLCSTRAVLPGECAATYATFVRELEDEFQPRTPMQHSLLPHIANLMWRLDRLPQAQADMFERELKKCDRRKKLTSAQVLARRFSDAPADNGFMLLNRYEASLRSQLLRLMSRYEWLKKHRPTTPWPDGEPPIEDEGKRPAWDESRAEAQRLWFERTKRTQSNPTQNRLGDAESGEAGVSDASPPTERTHGEPFRCGTQTTWSRRADASQHRPQVLEREPRDARGGGFVGVELDRRPARVPDVVQRGEHARKIDHPFARCEVLVDAVLPDVFQVNVRDVLGVSADDCGRVVADAEKMPDVAVHADVIVVLEEPVLELEVLSRSLDEQPRLGLDREDQILFSGARQDGSDSFSEQLAGGVARQVVPADQRAAGLQGDRCGAERRGEVDAAQRVIDAAFSLSGVALDPRRVVRVPAREQRERVDVTHREFSIRQVTLRRRAGGVVHDRRVGVAQVGHELDPAVADLADRVDRLVERVFLERVGGKGELPGHAGRL
jgi:hypothetical protein